VNVAFIWLALGVVFLAAFFDPRRPGRLLHLDLLVLVGFAAPIMAPSYFAISGRSPHVAVACVHLGLAYLIVRMLFAGFRPRRDRGPLVPVLPTSLLAAATVLLVVLRLGYVLAVDPALVDTGGAGVLGADRVTHGQPLYGERFSSDLPPHTDTYGPLLYLAYVPFEQVLPVGDHYWQGGAERAAAVAFDLLTMLALLALGRRLREGAEGRRLGVALAFAWAAYPYTFYVMSYGFNDALVALLLVCTLLVLSSPPARGVLAACAAGTKFAPAALAPLFATGTGERRARSAIVFAAVFAAVIVAAVVPFIPDGGLSELYHRTFGYQEVRGDSCCTVWSVVPGRHWLQLPLQLAVGALAIAVAFVPRRRTPAQVAALGAAVLMGVELTLSNWNPWYIIWFAPLVLVALLAVHGTGVEAPSLARRTVKAGVA
jgi:Glycosyltransferase family 87